MADKDMSDNTQTEGAAILKEMVDGLKGVTEGPWIKSGTQFQISEKCAAAGPQYGMLFFSPLGKTDKEAACAILDMKHIARCCPDNISAISAYVEALEAENKAALERVAVLENAIKLFMREVSTVANRMHHRDELKSGALADAVINASETLNGGAKCDRPTR